MPHSTVLSGRPAFRTSDVIRTPAEHRVTARTSITVKMGRDDAPQDRLIRTIGNRESISTELAKIEPDFSLKSGEVATHDSRTPLDRVAGVFITENGYFVRTEAMDDTPLGTLIAAMRAAAPKNPARPQSDSVKHDRKAERKAQDAACVAYLQALGWTGARLTPTLRQRVLDVFEAARQDAAYAAK